MTSLLLFACAAPQPAIVPSKSHPDVVVITLDTVRADRVGAYGHAKARTHTIDAMADAGIRFEQAISPLPLTIPAHSTMFTGLFPFHHGVRSNGDATLRPEHTTLAEVLHAEGYLTAAAVSAFVTTRQWGFDQGFDAYFDALPTVEVDGDSNYWHTERPGDQVVDDALGWLKRQPTDRPVFLWVHLYDAHHPYVARPAFKDMDPYDAEIAFLDTQVERVRQAFQGREALFALIGDHGESMGEHNEATHGLWSYQSTARVPFVLSGAGVKRGVVTEPVSTADLFPTVLAAVGVPVPAGIDGKVQPRGGQVPYVESYEASDRFRIAPHRAVVEGTLKLIGTPRPELYDLAKDPGETNDLASARPDDVARLLAKLEALGAEAPGEADASLDADALAQLAALGYVTGSEGRGEADPATFPDPKDNVAFFKAMYDLETLRSATPEDVLTKVEAVLALKPDAFEVRFRQATLLGRLGRLDEARDVLEETARLFPTRARSWVMLGSTAMREGRFEDALASGRRAVEAKPGDAAGHELVTDALLRLGREEEALSEARAALALNPRAYGVAAILGSALLAKRDFLEAEKLLRLAVSAPRPRRGARQRLAMLARAVKQRGDAYTLLETETTDYPGNLVAQAMLARMYGEDERWLDEKERHIAILRFRPGDPHRLRALAQADFNLGDYGGAREVLREALDTAPDDPDILLLHANLLAKEGRGDEGAVIAKRAMALHAERVKARAAKEAK